jgi:hypothetical protein
MLVANDLFLIGHKMRRKGIAVHSIEQTKRANCSAREQHQPASQMPLSDRQFTSARNAQQFTE